MDVAEILDGLLRATVVAGVALLVILALRRPMRRQFGALVAYRLWALLPAALLASWLPAPDASMTAFAMPAGYAATTRVAALPDAHHQWAWLLAAWLAGAVSMATLLWMRQRRFVRGIGRTAPTRHGELAALQASAGLPAAVGILRPRIVLPADFGTRYTPEQQTLMRCHERCHIRHGDLYANAAFALLRCVFWFNPLVHLAERAFRHDQELACDERVISRHPQARRAYGEAMLNTQLAAQPSPLACHWGYGHPLRERIEMLKQPLPSLPRWIGGSLVVCTLAAATAFTAWAAQPAQGGPSEPSRAVAAADPLPHTPAPPYPQAALDQRIGGKVVLLVDIDARGVPTSIIVEQAEPAGVFDQAATEAARQWRFTPESDNGRAVPGRVRVPVCFSPTGPVACSS